MERAVEILTIRSIREIPSLDYIRCIPREKVLRLAFDGSICSQREIIGSRLKNELTGFQVGVHVSDPEIYISKLITDREIEDNQDFFEKCANDYRRLSTELITKLATSLKLTIDPKFPLQTFQPLIRERRGHGNIDGWSYCLHGFHCRFTNRKTAQTIEITPLIFGLEFGELDPYFFTQYIRSTRQYQPLPIEIYDDYADGVRINEKMVALASLKK